MLTPAPPKSLIKSLVLHDQLEALVILQRIDQKYPIMTSTDTAFINRVETLGAVYTDLGYLVDVGVITDQEYEQITAKIPRRFTGKVNTPTSNLSAHVDNTHIAPEAQHESNTPSLLSAGNTGRKVPPAPSSRNPSPGPPAYTGVGQAEALYDYVGTEDNDLPFKAGDKITILEYVNNDWWRGQLHGREGLFPSNHVRKTADTGKPLEKVPYEQAQQYPQLAPGQYNPQQYQPIQYAPAPPAAQGAYGPQSGAPQPLTVVQDKKNGKLHSIGSKLGNAAIWGAGATMGADLVNSIF